MMGILMFDDLSSGQLVKIFALVSFLSVFVAMFIYFLFFPVVVNENVCEDVSLTVAPWALDTAKNWNKDNLAVSELFVDSCNKAKRINEFTWQVELKKC